MYAIDNDISLRSAILALMNETNSKDPESFNHWLKGEVWYAEVENLNLICCRECHKTP